MITKYFVLLVIFVLFQKSFCIRLVPKSNLIVSQDKLTITYNNPEYITGIVNISNPGTPEATSNADFQLIKVPPANTILKIFPIRQENGKFDVKGKTPVKHNICQYIKQDKILYPGFIKYGNLPRSCPIKEGGYWVRNYKVPVENLPAVVPPGKYKIIFDIGNDDIKLMILEWEGTVKS